MRYLADLHLHSHYSMATSRDLDPPHLFSAAALKGITLVGSGDFTHPGWRREMRSSFREADDCSGLYKLNPDLEKVARSSLPPSVRDSRVRFVPTAEISSIYKKNGRIRKVHNVVIMPSLEAADRLSDTLDRVGNIRSDGRPILGLDCRDLLEMCLDACAEVCFIPAHIWTPHFSVFGSKSGFDSLEECFEDLTGHIYALETGLSSDPPMNWRLSALDRYALVSNSDAHSPDKLAREANIFDTELSFAGFTSALKDRDPERFVGTLEFYPEEGKYHLDGHRACGVRLTPDQSAEYGGRCPSCGGKITEGVVGRVVELADRPAGSRPDAARHFESLVPLREVLAESLGKGPGTKSVQAKLDGLREMFGSEMNILRRVPTSEIEKEFGDILAEAISRVREGRLTIEPGYDGEFGRVKIFSRDGNNVFPEK